MYNPYQYNPYQFQPSAVPQPPQMAQQVVRVNGEGGARMLSLAPNSSALVLDETAPLVWLIVTDGAGYKTVSPYAISEYKTESGPTLQDLADRIKRLEDQVSDQSYTERAERSRAGAKSKPSATAVPSVPSGE